MKLTFFTFVLLIASMMSCMVQRAEKVSPAIGDPAAAHDDRQPVLVELFTSEGCSSCPPADKQLAFLEKDQPVAHAEIITLAFHVDYWNRLGWVDRYSSPQFSERQNRYVRMMGLSSSYTPQMVVDGQFEFVGSDPGRANVAIAKSAKETKAGVDAKMSASTIDLSVGDLKQHRAATVYLATAEDGIVTQVKGGENGGRKLPHVSVVRQLDVIGQVPDSASGFEASVKVPVGSDWKIENLKYVVLVQEDATGKILAVGKARREK